jgi:hypothetical protein
MSYYRARYYDARVGRFLSEDPIGFAGGDVNLYRYVGNSPINYTDPSGLIAWAPLLIGAGLLPLVFDGLWTPVQAPTQCGDIDPGLPWYYRLPLEVGISAGVGAAPGAIDDVARVMDDVGRGLDDWLGRGPTLAPAGGGSFGRGGAIGSGRIDNSFRQRFAMQGGEGGSFGGQTGGPFDVGALSSAAGQMDKGGALTKAGRALQKHAVRPGSAFPLPKGNEGVFNSQGQQIVDDILNNPASTFTKRSTGRFGEVIDVIAPDGRGIRYTSNGEFVGFLEP